MPIYTYKRFYPCALWALMARCGESLSRAACAVVSPSGTRDLGIPEDLCTFTRLHTRREDPAAETAQRAIHFSYIVSSSFII